MNNQLFKEEDALYNCKFLATIPVHEERGTNSTGGLGQVAPFLAGMYKRNCARHEMAQEDSKF